ncbi:phage terminase small subunit-related protein [Sporomusa sp. KB1]|jgi:uncharacterized protein YjcR|uniref:phage terminase small subunit-related protein n=1 Tax=Sporomusa sp. KB1 TaxID=943346 RepID=UPI00119ECE7F|nr:phage terminase small subunit-related protein [Sporomusa sp. KB1]TWH48542.1 uncharacterized protein YjcR [Sporomusa sp. KB1]
MAGRPRNPDRDKAFQIWSDSGGTAKLKDIANEIGVPDSRIRKWKTEDNWDERIQERSDINKGALLNAKGSAPKHGAPKGNHNAAGHGAPKGNKNAVGNRGGPGGPFGNKKAVTTGEYETIWWDCLTEEEQVLCSAINTDTLAQVEEDIRLITVRERRMMERIRRLMNGLTEKERKVLQELVKEKVAIPVTHEVTGETKIVTVDQSKMVITEITETECRAIDDILKLEEALTRIQDKKTRQLALKHSVESANKGDEGDAAAKDHAKRVQEAWANR